MIIMKFEIDLDTKYVFDVYFDRYEVKREKPTVVVYLTKTQKEGTYKKTLCEYVENPKSFFSDNPPVNEALSNDCFMLLRTVNRDIDENLKRYYTASISRFNSYFDNNEIELSQ